MFKVIEKKSIVIFFVALSMIVIPFLAEVYAGGGKHGGMGGSTVYSTGGCCGGTSYNTSAYTNTASRYLGNYGYSPYYSNYSTVPRYTYSTVPRYNSALYPTNAYSPYNWGSQYSVGGWPSNYGYGGNIVPVTTKDYTVEESYTRYIPGGEYTTTVAETTDTDYISVNNRWPINQQYYGLNSGSLYNPYGNTYGFPNTYPYGYGSNSWTTPWLY